MTVTLIIAWGNLFGALVAWIAEAYASRHSPNEVRPFFAVAAMLDFAYFVSFLWLVANIERAAVWSAYMRPVGLVAWLAARAGVAIAVAIAYSRQRKQVQALTQRVTEMQELLTKGPG